jgi:hypothetical protein
MTEETQKDSAQTLAEKIVETLINEGMASQGKKAEILAKLAAGTAKAEDWGLWTELALAKGENNQQDAGE